MTAHLLLLCHAATASMRAGAFPDGDEPLDPNAASKISGLAPYSDRQWVSPARRARETAAILGLGQAAIEPDLAECDYGLWRGQTLTRVHEREPDAVAEWLRDPAKRPHGGESVVDLIARIRPWLARQAQTPGVTLAVTHASVIRAVIVAAIDADARAFARIDVAPLALARLSGHAGRWNLVGLGRLVDSST